MALGGGVRNAGGTLTLDSCAIRDNSASSGGGVYNDTDSTLFVTSCVIEGNVATGATGGAGILNKGSLYLEDTAIRNNQADAAGANGGGLLNDNSALDEVEILRSTFSGNSAEQVGSAIHDQGDGVVLMVNSTITANIINAAYGPGAGTIVAGLAGPFEIIFSTISGNLVIGSGVSGGIVAPGPVVISNSIIANNDFANCSIEGSGSITSEGNNIESGTDCGFTSGGDMQNTDPLLDSLADNGGPTWTMALSPDSPAIDVAGDQACAHPTVDGVDQRGVARPIGAACDIGAFEAKKYIFLPLISR